MKSSGGQYYIGLEHLRGLAALLVFFWHFLHVNQGHIKGLDSSFSFPFNAFFTEGHTGVALFMVLSGYLFSKITSDRKILFFPFLLNRVLRLLPLLFVVLILKGIASVWVEGTLTVWQYFGQMLKGLVFPSLPNGGWSITVEFQFYLLLPFLIMRGRRSPSILVGCLFGSFLIRLGLFLIFGTSVLKEVAYFTLIGRMDQFIFGILLCQKGQFLKKRNKLAVGLLSLWGILWYAFDLSGGYYGNPKNEWLWLIIPTAEGIFYGILVAWYDLSFSFSSRGFSKLLAKVGEVSYSIYLWHFFLVFWMAKWINENIIALTNFYTAVLFGGFCFAGIFLWSCLSYRYVETIFLAKRRTYLQ